VKTRFGVCVLVLAAAFALGPAPALAQSKIVERWVLTGLPMPKIKKILVIAVLENYLVRQQFEDEMEKLLAKQGVEGVRSHMVLPPRNELMEGELKKRILEDDYDAVLVVRPRAVRKESQEVVTGVMYVPPPGYYNFWPYWTAANTDVYVTSSYFKENTIVRAEFNLYNTKNEKLIWNGESDTIYSKKFDEMGKSYAKMLVNQLKKDKVIGKK
jgi:hypothetical protein